MKKNIEGIRWTKYNNNEHQTVAILCLCKQTNSSPWTELEKRGQMKKPRGREWEREMEENNRPSSDPSAKHPQHTQPARQSRSVSSLPFFKQSPQPTILLIQLLRLKEQRVFGLLLMLISRPFCMESPQWRDERMSERANDRTSVVNAQNQMLFSL